MLKTYVRSTYGIDEYESTHVNIQIAIECFIHRASMDTGDTQHLILYESYKQQAQKSTHTQGAYTFKWSLHDIFS